MRKYNHTTVDELKQLTQLAIQEKACFVFMFHGIVKENEPDSENLYNYKYNNFKEFAKYLSELKKSGEIDILTNKEAFLSTYKLNPNA